MGLHGSEKYYGDSWKMETLECDKCGWQGLFKEGTTEESDTLMTCRCPQCRDPRILGMITLPTGGESRAPSLAELELELRHLVNYKITAEMDNPSKLPDIAEAVKHIVLTWEIRHIGHENGADHYIVIRHGSTVIYNDVAVWGGIDRFEEVVSILKGRYGRRLADVQPTEEAVMWLMGDSSDIQGIAQRILALFKERMLG